MARSRGLGDVYKRQVQNLLRLQITSLSMVGSSEVNLLIR
jgi:hypothetical protein